MQFEHLFNFGEDFSINEIRDRIKLFREFIKERRNQDFVSYYIKFKNTPYVKNKDNSKANQIDVFRVDIDPKTLYPYPLDKQSWKIFNTHTKKEYPFNQLYYKRNWDVINALGILIAEQLRFNTLDVDREVIDYEANTPENLFYFLWDRYKDTVYNNWMDDPKYWKQNVFIGQNKGAKDPIKRQLSKI